MYNKLIKLKNECINELDSISEIPTIHDYSITFEVNYRAKKRLGQCTKNGLNYRFGENVDKITFESIDFKKRFT